jgi:cobalamin biosynthesis protein CobD/CbiB
MASMAGALRVQLEKPGQYAVGDAEKELNAKMILRSLRIRNVTIILAIVLTLPVFLLTNFYFFPL